MGTFTTKIPIGGIGFVIRGHLDYYIQEMRVGMVEIKQKHPEAVIFSKDKVYEERYMCFETGVGSGTLYTYGEHIFSTKEDAENIGLVKHRQRAYKEIAKRDEFLKKRKEEEESEELRQLEYLKEKYKSKLIED